MLAILGIFLIFIAIVWLIAVMIMGKYNYNYPKNRKEKLNNLAILIPFMGDINALDELLTSIVNQTFKVNMNYVFVIVDKDNDPAIQLANKYGATAYVRKNLEFKGKGYAIREVIEFLVQNNIFYEAYFILDADSVLDNDYIERMEESYKQGYDIGVGFRNLKNGNTSLIAAATGMVYQLINVRNETKAKESRNVSLAGGGYYITGNLIREWKTFPFVSLTEDNELTLNSVVYSIPSTCNKRAIFYGSLPTNYKETVYQRARWIKGYFINYNEYIPTLTNLLEKNSNYGSVLTEVTGVWPYLLIALGTILYILDQIVRIFNFFSVNMIFSSIKNTITILLVIYLCLFIMVFLAYSKDSKVLRLSKDIKLKTLLFTPLFLISYLHCACIACFKRDEIK